MPIKDKELITYSTSRRRSRQNSRPNSNNGSLNNTTVASRVRIRGVIGQRLRSGEPSPSIEKRRVDLNDVEASRLQVEQRLVDIQ